MKRPIIYFTVTNDLNYDQRMIRICSSLAGHGYQIFLIGRQTKNSIILHEMPFQQKRLKCLFEKGKLFYMEYNIRLFIFLFFRKMDGICAIDLDTILPCLWISKIKKTKRIYDAHELFCEMKEIVSRPEVYNFWKRIEKYAVPQFEHAYTVNEFIAEEFKKMYGHEFNVIRSISVYNKENYCEKKEGFILYQGAVNEGRSFETLIPAMQYVDANLVICGDGNFMHQAIELVKKSGLEQKVIFKGMLPPSELKSITCKAYIGITIFEKDAKSNYYSLANRFFDYIHACTPQLCVDYPVYHELNKKYEIGVLIADLRPETIAKALNDLLKDDNRWLLLHENCKKTAQELCWQNEELKLLTFYKTIFG